MRVSSHTRSAARAIARGAKASSCPATPCAGDRTRRRRIGEVRIRDVALVDAEHAFDAADHATDRGADHRADRTRDAVAFMKSMRRAARHALRLRGQRSRNQLRKVRPPIL